MLIKVSFRKEPWAGLSSRQTWEIDLGVSSCVAVRSAELILRKRNILLIGTVELSCLHASMVCVVLTIGMAVCKQIGSHCLVDVHKDDRIQGHNCSLDGSVPPSVMSCTKDPETQFHSRTCVQDFSLDEFKTEVVDVRPHVCVCVVKYWISITTSRDCLVCP